MTKPDNPLTVIPDSIRNPVGILNQVQDDGCSATDAQQDALIKLNADLERYQTKLFQLQKVWAKSKVGSRYGDEYLESQIRVYQSITDQVQEEITRLESNILN
jgi:cob(I)alamin adenosyltransferase